MDDNQGLASLLCSAHEIEERGAYLYRRLAEAVPDGFIREVFERLEKAERRHLASISLMTQDVGQYPLICRNLTEESRNWPEMFREKIGGTDLKSDIDSEETSLVVKALAEAQNFEMEAIRFYEGWTTGNSSGIECDLCGRLIEEEKSHFILLDEMIDYFSATVED